MRKIFSVFLLMILMVSPAWALFEMSFQADKNQITLGEEVAVTIEIIHSGEFKIKPINKNIKLDPFELKRIEKISPIEVRSGVREGYRVVLTIFELGEFKIPPITVHFETQDKKDAKVQTEEISVTVVSVGRRENDKDDIRPIKSPYSLISAGSWKKFFLWFFAAILLLLVIYGIVRFVLSKRKYVDPESLLTPHERALRRLDNLPDKKYLQTNKTKQYYSELSFIIERYLIEQFGIISEGMTTEEIMINVEKGIFDRAIKESLTKVLNLSDLAKFAKWVPDLDESENARIAAREIVVNTMPVTQEEKK